MIHMPRTADDLAAELRARLLILFVSGAQAGGGSIVLSALREIAAAGLDLEAPWLTELTINALRLPRQ